ncbi:hypothetical protein ACIQXV_15615 [Neobacillus sp. NPDC097160]|uniref:hypothetical protein n=1 Tax=Neobacillus sp. NPDC097160 TaxID=3364298 RepID=UPI00381D0BAD
MSLKMAATTNNVLVGEKNCVLCSEKMDYVAIVSGKPNLEELQLVHKGKVITDQVVVLKKSYANNGNLKIVDVEMTVRCPYCQSNNQFTTYLTIENVD